MAPLRILFVRFYRAYSSRSATKTSNASGSDVSILRYSRVVMPKTSFVIANIIILYLVTKGASRRCSVECVEVSRQSFCGSLRRHHEASR